MIHDADLWLDYVDMLIENKLDARNPHYLCPLNVEEAHDWVMGKCKKKYSEKDEKDYIAAKSRSGIGKPFGLLQRGKVVASLCIQQRLL